ncbi:MAG: SLC13 family permease [Acidobacteriota bacterium]
MSTDTLLMLGLLAATLVVFALEVFSIEVTAMLMLVVLVAVGFVEPAEAVAGLSNKAVVTIGALFVLSRALVKTGALEFGAFYLSYRFGRRKWLAVAMFLAVVGLLSGFLNNTAIVAVFIPLAMSLCRRLEISPSKVMLPLSYISILGGCLTVIGTSTNLLVSALAEANGQAPLGMFEFTHLGALFLVLGLTYAVVVGWRTLPIRVNPASLTTTYNLASYLMELQIPPDSKLIGRTCRDLRMRERYGITVLSILRGERRMVTGLALEPLQSGDVLIVEGSLEDVLRLRNDQRVDILPGITLDDRTLSEQGQMVVEGLVPLNSKLVGKTVKESNFRRNFGAFVLAIRRHGETIYSRLAETPLQASDTLLMIATEERFRQFLDSEDIQVISEMETAFKRQRLWWLPLVLLPAIVILEVFDVMDLHLGSLLSVVLLLALGVMSSREAYRSVEWSVIFLIAAFVPVGDAMLRTGTAEFMASGIQRLASLFPAGWEPYAVLSLVYLITSLTTQMVSNNAAAIILTPVALAVAGAMSLDPRPFLVAICFAASAEFMTPMGYQTNMMVYGPGGYRFMDYVRFGAPLNLTLWVLSSLLIPYFWPF